jgi:hypothetical protein
MIKKPNNAAGYPSDQAARVKATCLYLATKLGDLMPELVVVGGLVPSLLVDQQNLPENVEPHAGTLDLDLGLAFAFVGEERYQEVSERLRNAGFSPDKNSFVRCCRMPVRSRRWNTCGLISRMPRPLGRGGSRNFCLGGRMRRSKRTRWALYPNFSTNVIEKLQRVKVIGLTALGLLLQREKRAGE